MPVSHIQYNLFKNSPKKVYDPTCGSGSTLIEASKVNPNLEFYGTDIDNRCAKMCALNMLMFDLNAYVQHGDTLTMETYKVWRIRKGGYIVETEPQPAPPKEEITQLRLL